MATQIAEILVAKGIQHTVFGNWPQNLDEFTDAWIVGGDGTLNYFINKYPEVKIPLSIFKGGTGNDFSSKLYGKITLEEQVEKILTVSPKQVDAAICNDKLYINSLGIGFDGEVLKKMKSVRRVGGHIGYLLIVISKVFSFKEFTFLIKSDVYNVTKKLLIVMINNNTRTGGGFLVTPAAKIDDGKLDLFMVEKLNFWQRLKTLAAVEKGRYNTFCTSYQLQQVVINTGKPAFAALDGELIEAREFIIKVLPGRFNFRY